MRKLLLKLQNKHFLVLSGNALLSLFGLGTYALLGRLLSFADAGKYFFFLTVISILDAIRNGFLETATVKFYAGTEPKRAATVLGSVWFLSIALTFLVLLINGGCLFLLPFIHNDGLNISIRWFGLTFLSSLPFGVMYWKLQADEEYGKMLWLKMVNSLSTPLSFMLLYFFGKMTLENVVLYNFLTNCLTSFVGIFGGLARMKTVFSRSKESILELAHFGKYCLGTSLSAVLFGSTDTFIITFVLGPAALAVYTFPRKLMEVNELFIRSFVVTGRSGMAIAFNQDNLQKVAYIMKKYAGMLTIAFIPLAVAAILFSDLAINIMAGAKYAGTEAANIYKLLMIIAVLSPIDRFNGTTLDMIGKPKTNFYKVIIMLVVNITADFAALAIYKNLYSVVFAGLFTLLSGILFGYINLRKYIDYSMWGILSTGFKEMKAFLQKQLRISSAV